MLLQEGCCPRFDEMVGDDLALRPHWIPTYLDRLACRFWCKRAVMTVFQAFSGDNAQMMFGPIVYEQRRALQRRRAHPRSLLMGWRCVRWC